MTTYAEPADMPAPRPTSRRPSVEDVRMRLHTLLTAAAPYVVALDGVLLGLVGVVAIIGSSEGAQGEGLLLLVGGLALVLFGLLMILRWNPSAVRTGLIGLTAGYFATSLTQFEVATDPCDVGGTFERCVGQVAGGEPWGVYQGPVILAVLLFVFIAFEPLLRSRTDKT